MIKTKHELVDCLQADGANYPKVSGGLLKRLKNRIVTSPQSTTWKIYSYIRNLRFAEYHLNNSILANSVNLHSLYHTLCLL